MINPYEYSPNSDGTKCELEEETTLYSHFSVNLPSAISGEYLGNNRIIGEYVFPKNREKAPLALLIHGMGNRSVVPCKMLSLTLAKQGIASFVLYLVFHSKRSPEAIKRKYPRLSAEEWFESYQISVTDIRQVLDWAESRSDIIADKISIAGISFGGIISAIAMGLDERIKAGVLIVSGGNSDKITRDSLLMRWQYHITKDEFRHNQALIASTWQKWRKKDLIR